MYEVCIKLLPNHAKNVFPATKFESSKEVAKKTWTESNTLKLPYIDILEFQK